LPELGPRRRARADAGGLAARRLALTLVSAVLDAKRTLDRTLATDAQTAGLPPRDLAFARLLAATTLRRLGEIDALIAPMLTRPLPARARLAHHILRLGACQIAFLDTAAYAAVDTSVSLATGSGQRGYARVINALLRRLDRERSAAALPVLAPPEAARLNTPDWLWQTWSERYGPIAASAIAVANLGEAPLDLTPKQATPDAWAEQLGAERLPTGTLRLPAGGAVQRLPGYEEGAWWVQDAAAALPAKLLGDVRGCRIADLCCAPGGKTAQLAAAGAEVIAIDVSSERLALTASNLSRLQLTATLVQADAAAWRPADPMDAVLLDVPCTATGTIRRHPDVLRLKTPAEMAKLMQTQERLLRHALTLVRPGGTVLYCACSLQPQEAEDVVARVLADTPETVRAPINAAEVGGMQELLSPAGELRSLPCHLAAQGGIDGFYAARLVRRH
jgi:16S rRNA (cytosine967-C5)-methyltransferase